MPPRARPQVVEVRRSVYRATSYDVPLWVSPNRRPGRFNDLGNAVVQYASLHPGAPFAELVRHQGVEDDVAAAELRTTIWELGVHEGAVADYRTPETVAVTGFPFEALVDDDWERCQAEAEWLAHQGVGGVLTPSAALPGDINLTLFGPRVAVSWGRPVALASAVPARALVTGPPPTGLIVRVRHFGTAFPEADALPVLRVAAGQPLS